MAKNNELHSLYTYCMLCPRACGVDRTRGETGLCGQSSRMKLASACLHKGEEPPLCGAKGSGMLFFSGCTLKCASCQNYQLSGKHVGAYVTESELAGIILSLQKKGASNINIVTGTHFLPGIIHALRLARNMGVKLPVVWNTSGYESADTVARLNAYVDVYLADVKTLNKSIACALFCASDYPQRVKAALKAMIYAKPLRLRQGRLVRGVIIRHLVLPGEIAAAEQVLAWYKEKPDKKALFSLMTQFIPAVISGRRGAKPGPGRTTAVYDRLITRDEYDEVIWLLEKYDIKDGFLQEFSEDRTWLPDFTRHNPFPEGCAQAVWHYSAGFIDDDVSTMDE
jgi:putative pyruvate formate lyase activating enzyme